SFALTLLLQELALARDVTPVTFGKDILAHRRHGLASDDLATDGSLYGHFEELTGNQLAQPLGQASALLAGSVTVHDGTERIHALAADEDIQLDELGFAKAGDFV